MENNKGNVRNFEQIPPLFYKKTFDGLRVNLGVPLW